MKRSNELNAIDIAAVQSRMLTIRNQQVLLDRDVAALYGVETKALNQAVKRNAEKFPDGYILRMTAEECSRSQIVTLNGATRLRQEKSDHLMCLSSEMEKSIKTAVPSTNGKIDW